MALVVIPIIITKMSVINYYCHLNIVIITISIIIITVIITPDVSVDVIIMSIITRTLTLFLLLLLLSLVKRSVNYINGILPNSRVRNSAHSSCTWPSFSVYLFYHIFFRSLSLFVRYLLIITVKQMSTELWKNANSPQTSNSLEIHGRD